MKRWRRPLILIPLLLLAGAAVNVIVAWILAGAPGSWTPGGPQAVHSWDSEPSDAARLQQIANLLGTPPDWTAPTSGVIARGVGWTAVAAMGAGRREDRWYASRVESGWPLRSMVTKGSATSSSPDWRYSPSFDAQRLLPVSGWFDSLFFRNRAPLTPIPAGFAINTLFYTAILALPLSYFPIRRRLRARRGRCPTCGYDLVGLGEAAQGGPPLRGGRAADQAAAAAACCPECGATR